VPGRCKVLVAESDAKAAKALASHLLAKGYEVIAASDAVGALSAAREQRPDVTVMSGQLAGGGGIVALKRIRSNVYTTNIPVIAIVGKSARPKEFLNVGAQECLASPVKAEDIVQAIERHRLEELDFTEAPKAVLRDPPRLVDLDATKLLDTPPEESFDRLTRLAAKILGTPVALMTLVDRDRQFFKSQVGLGQPYAKQRQTRLSHSFCQWVVSGREALVVPDANAHPVLKSNLAIRDMGVVAYAGVPLAGRTGEAIGSFCAIDHRPREWTEDDLATLRDLADVTEAYATLEHAKSARRGSAHEVSMHVAGNAVLGAVRILRRHGAKLDEAQRNQLLGIIEEQGRHLVESVPARPR